MALEAILAGLVEVKGATAAAAQIRGLGAEIQAAGAASTRSAGQMGKVGTALSGVGRFASSTGSMLTRYVSAPLALIGGAAVGMAIKFDTSFARIQGLAGRLGMSMDQAKAKVLGLASATGQGPQQLADALYFVASAGLKASSVFPVLEASAKGAEIGMGDVAQVAQTLTSLLNAYAGTGLSAGNAMNIMTAAVKDGKAEMSDFATGLGPVIAVAANAGVSFSDLAAGIAQATNLGVSFDRAVTGMRFLIGSLSNPTDKAKSALNDFGISATGLAADIKSRGLIPVLQDLYDKFQGAGAAGRAAWAAITGGQRGAIVAVDLVGKHVEATNSILRDTGAAAKDSATNFKDAFGTIVKNDPAIAFQKTMATLKADLITLGNDILPFVTKALGYIDHLAKGFSNLSSAQQANVLKWGAILLAAGPVLRIFGGLWGVGTRLVGMFYSMGKAIAALATARAVGGLASVGATLATVGSNASTAAGGLKLFVANKGGVVTGLRTIGSEAGPAATGLALVGGGATTAAAGLGLMALGIAALVIGAKQFNSNVKQAAANVALLGANTGLTAADVSLLVHGMDTSNPTIMRFNRGIAYGGTSAQTTGAKLDELTAAHNRLLHKLGLATPAIRTWDTWMGVANWRIKDQLGPLAQLYGKLGQYGGRLTDLQKNEIQHALAVGDITTALGIMTGAVDHAKKSTDAGSKSEANASAKADGLANSLRMAGLQASGATPKVKGTGDAAQTAGGKAGTAATHVWNLVSAINALHSKTITITTAFIYSGRNFNAPGGGPHPTALGGILSYGRGAILAGQSGFIARSPVRLVGEGSYPTFAGRGAEAVVPLDTRGIAILSKAMTLALQPLLGKIAGGDGRQLVVVPVVFRDEFRREVQGALMKDVRFRSPL